MAFGYTLVVTTVALALATLLGGFMASRKLPVHHVLDWVAGLLHQGGIAYAIGVVGATAFVAFCAVVLLRYLLLTLFTARR